MTRFFSLVLATALVGAAQAGTTWGNPTGKVVLDSGSAVQVGSLRAYSCPGQETVGTDGTLSTSGSLSFTLSEDSWCDMDIQVKWSGSSTWDVVPVDGFTTYITEAAEVERTIRLDPTDFSATLE